MSSWSYRWKENCNTCRCLHGEVACTRELCQPTPTPRGTLPEICHLPAVKPDTELCAGFEARWTFNVKTEKCEPVVYGGCGGTENLFTNEQECLMTCGNQQQESNKVSDGDPRERCFMPIVPGPCFGQLIRYAFFTERNRCEKFYFGGCQGNQNNFVTFEECRSMCGGSLPPLDDSKDIKVEA
ncbi:Tissue factor pathway inhibitor [Armadillidium nasatum]|uniref:Tissue factor pathway inhibitor n=1 Tax=Armadillidium nasatum TaxID=96803 RepID=A0A5N5T771_9CRUS|nr:Tissue factor pathway inhibitor [Armadillidium nasatum]